MPAKNKVKNEAMSEEQKTASELALIQKEVVASIIGIISYIVLIISADQDKQLLLQRQNSSESSKKVDIPTNSTVSNINPGETVAASSWIGLIAFIMLTEIALVRLNQRQASIQAGTTSASIAPNVYIAAGYIIIVLGIIIKSIGFQQRASQEAQPLVIA